MAQPRVRRFQNERTRVTFFLPVKDREHHMAVTAVIDYLQKQREEQERQRARVISPATRRTPLSSVVRALRGIFGSSSSQGAAAASEGLLPVTGFTHSSTRLAAYTGYWWDGHEWVIEPVSEFIIDFDLTIETGQLDNIADKLENKIRELYSENESEQDEIWIIAQQIIRFT